MGLPFFSVTDDPGTSFRNLMAATGISRPVIGTEHEPPHATTVVAIRCNDGVVLVADRQATGNYIAMRDTRKIGEADRHTAIAISGSAAAGMEFIRLSQLSFEHYEKMSQQSLSLEGKANYVSGIVLDNNMSTPFTIVPLLAGYDLNHQRGRVFEYDVAGGCYEHDDFVVIGSGSPFAESTLRLGYRDGITLDEAIDLGALSIYEAGDNDPSTGGPDFVRGIFPIIVTVTAAGFVELDQEASAERFTAINERRMASKGRAGGALR